MIPCLLPNPTTNRPVLLHKTPLIFFLKTKHTDAQSSFLVTLSIKITIEVDHVWEKTHIKTHPENPSFYLETDPNTQNSCQRCTKIITIIIINQQQKQTNP
jgi:phospholipase C